MLLWGFGGRGEWTGVTKYRYNSSTRHFIDADDMRSRFDNDSNITPLSDIDLFCVGRSVVK